jgi:hypothetical protein
MLFEPDDVSLCMTNPGFDVDVFVRTDLATLYAVWLGRMELRTALHEKKLNLDGDARLVRAVIRSIAPLSPVAYAVRAAERDRVRISGGEARV